MKKPKRPAAPTQPKTPATVARGHAGGTPAKPAPSAKKKPGHVSPAVRHARHVAAVKAAKTRAKNAAKATPRKWSPDSDIALCSARAVAESLRLALHVAVSDAAVLGLYWRTASHPDAGASIVATLRAVQEYGLDGFRPVRFECVTGDSLEDVDEGCVFGEPVPAAGEPHSKILIAGLDMITPHAAAWDGAWWSWGEPWHPPPDAVIDELWAIEWR